MKKKTDLPKSDSEKSTKSGSDTARRYLPYLVALAVFITITVIYCFPAVQGKVLLQSDVLNFKGMVQESKSYTESQGQHPWWTGSMFSGMPTYQIGNNRFASTPWLRPFTLLSRSFFNGTMGLILGYFICFFILLRSFKVNKWLCIVGSIAITFSSYFFIIIQAGHITKAVTLAFVAPLIGGFYLIFNKKYIPGILLTMIYTSIGFMLHIQMSYYISMMIGLMFIAEIVVHCKERRFKDLGLATLLFAVAFFIGLGTNTGKYLTNREYAKETMRGGHSELVKADDDVNKTSGLDLSYATQWSYGIDETFSLLIPNIKGGSSNYVVGENSKVHKALIDNHVGKRNADEFANQQLPMYWGKQPFTSGPVYIGAIVCLLFIFGLLIVKGPYKWALLAATLFSIMLSWGKNFMGMTRFFFDYFPMYSKFRAVSSILIVAEIAMPLLAFLAIEEVVKNKVPAKTIINKLLIATGITGGICLFFALFGGSLYDFVSPNDHQIKSQLPAWLYAAILDQRESMLRTDALRSLLFIAAGAATIWLFVSKKIKMPLFTIILGLLVVCDMYPVNKRFFNDGDFVSKKEYDKYFQIQPYEKQILQDKDPNFRVLNLTSNTFNDSRTSYRLKSIGGYHGAKLRRYQDLIDQHISKNNFEVLNMLNTKYIVTNGQQGSAFAQRNPSAYGNAWFVDSLVFVNTPNEESEALNTINLRTTAVADAKFTDKVTSKNPTHDPNAQIALTSYNPDKLTYNFESKNDELVVFSEIYYPYGWKAYIDGKFTEHFRANYTLRGLSVPAGNHKIVFEFTPDSVRKGNIISMIFVAIMYATIIGSLCLGVSRHLKRKQKADA